MSVVNPDFTPGTAISSSAIDANFADIAAEITNSVALNGESVMTDQLKAANGTDSLPGFTFGSDLDCGLYRIGANNIGLALNGAKVVDFMTTGVAITGTFAFSGNLAINTDKFTVEASSGNTVVAGTLTATGGFATLAAPATSDGAALGSTTKMWSDLFLASGAVINFNNGDVTATHSANALAFAGASSGYTFDTSVTVGNGLTVTTGAVNLPNGSVADADLASPGCMKLISSQAASSSGTIDFNASNSAAAFDGTYSYLVLKIANAKPANDDVEAWLRVGTGGTPTYQTSSYEWNGNIVVNAVGAVLAGTTADAKIVMTRNASTGDVGNATGENFSCEIVFNRPDATDFMTISFKAAYMAAVGNLATSEGMGVYKVAGAITALRFLFESGAIASGTFSLYGIKNA